MWHADIIIDTRPAWSCVLYLSLFASKSNVSCRAGPHYIGNISQPDAIGPSRRTLFTIRSLGCRANVVCSRSYSKCLHNAPRALY
jgi:hypothetical protein